MSQDTIKCPNCGENIKITEVISRDMENIFEVKYEKKFSEWQKKEKSRIEKETTQRLQESQGSEIIDLKDQVSEKDAKLKEFQKQELELRKKNRDLDEKSKNLELEVARQVDAEQVKIEEAVAKRKDEEHRLKDAEKEKQLADLRTQIDDLKRKAEQSSQQMQGEVLEVELEQILREEFPFDSIDPIGKGVKGADVLQTVKTQSGRICGKILWETKRTKTWSDSWIKKLKDDQRDAKADLAVIVSEALPKGFHHFRQIKSVWVAEIPSAVSLAIALRTILIQVEKTREIQTGKEEKMEVVYNYLTGPEFKNRVQAIMEAFIEMQKDLHSERRAMERKWAKQEKHMQRVVSNIAGMHGDLEGIVGASLPSVRLLELPADEEYKK